MDPLSITAGILAIATAAAQISKAISRLRAFGEVPGRVYALKNEVTDLEVVLRQLLHNLDQKSLGPDTDYKELAQLLERTKSRLSELAKALERVAIACTAGNEKVIRRTAIWWKEKALFQTLQDDIRGVKTSLSLMLGASTSLVTVFSLLIHLHLDVGKQV